jgi:multimeric flavodoxin WrbA
MTIVDHLVEKGTHFPSPSPQVLGVGGSPRKGGNSDILLSRLLKGVGKSKIGTQVIQLREVSFQGCIGCEKCRKHGICTGLIDGMSMVYPYLLDAWGLVLVSPTHNYNITSWMKAFIDRLYCFYDFDDNRPRGWHSRLAGQKRKAVLGAVCEQENSSDMGFTLEAMREPLQALGYEIFKEIPVFSIFDRGKIKEEYDVLANAEKVGVDFGDSLL